MDYSLNFLERLLEVVLIDGMYASHFATVLLFFATFHLSFSESKEHLDIRPLLPRKTSGQTLFTLMDDEATGVRYVKKVIPEKQLSHLQKNSSFSDKPSIRGVCAGDFDGDERPDIFFAYP